MKFDSNAFAKKYIQFVSKSPWKLFIIACLLLIGAVWYTSGNLRLNNSLASLLPDNSPSIIALEESTRRFGSSDKFMIAMKGNDPVLLAALQDTLSAQMKAEWSDFLVGTQISRDNQFFVDHALLYLPVHHLERIRDNLVTIQRDLSGAVNPFMVELKEAETDSVTGEKSTKKASDSLVWFESDIPQELGLPDEAADAFRGFYGGTVQKDSGNTVNSPQQEEKWDPKANIPEHLRNRLMGQAQQDSSFNAIIQCKLTGSSTDLDFTQMVIDKTNALLKPYQDKYPNVTLMIKGSYEGLEDVKDLKSDGLIATLISVGLIILMMLWFFRSFMAVLLLVGQLLFSTGFMFFFTALTYGQLNPYTLFVAAIIIGMGIDFSIHMMGGAQRFNTTHNLEDSLVLAMAHLLKPMFLAALTTVAGLLTLLIADFKGFYEFGVIAGAGVVLSVCGAVFGLPVLILLAKGLPKVHKADLIPSTWDDAQTTKVIHKSALVLTGILFVGILFIPFAEFEHDFRNLRPAKKEKVSNQPVVHHGVAMETTRKSAQPAAVMGDTQEELDKLYDSLMYRMHQEKDPMLQSFLTLKTFVPPEDAQEERMEIIEEINDLIHARVFNRVEGENAEMVQKLRTMAEVEEFTAEDIPDWALDLLKERDGTYGTIGFIYGRYESWDARQMKAFQDRYGHWNFGGKDLRVFSSAYIVSDVIEAVKRDSARMGLFIMLVLVATLALALRNIRQALIAIIPLTAAIILTTGIMGFLNLAFSIGKISMYNVIVVPMALGVGIDATIHMLHAILNRGSQTLAHVYNTTGRMVMMASLTTVGGFLGMLFINHKGLRTIGEVAVVAITATLITALIYTPWLLTRLKKSK
jgi:uncharacterized protein